MDWQFLLEPDVQEFIKQNAKADIAKLALKRKSNKKWPMPLILDQIKIRQKAALKTPAFCNFDEFIFPPHDFYEQASSEACAIYKTRQWQANRLVDLTGGCGVDAFYFAKQAKEIDIVEHNIVASSLLQHNAGVLIRNGFISSSVRVHQCMAHEFLEISKEVDVIYIDPQRREKHRSGLYDFEACSPDVIYLLDRIMSRANKLIIKASPILDINSALKVLKDVCEVHVIGWQNDCKEVLYFIDKNRKCNIDNVLIKAVEIDDKGNTIKYFEYKNVQDHNDKIEYSLPQEFIFEPGPAFQKAGGFRQMSKAYSLKKLHPNTHLFTSSRIIDGFPGKCYRMLDIKSVGQNFSPLTHAEISVRNFPEKPDVLRKRIKLKDGGNHRIFAVTLVDGSKKLLVTQKIT